MTDDKNYNHATLTDIGNSIEKLITFREECGDCSSYTVKKLEEILQKIKAARK